MATLFNTKIKDTYQSLLKLEDNTILTTTVKNVTDGLGNASPLYMSTTRVGIGTNAPTTTLDVNGSAKVSGAVSILNPNYMSLTSNYTLEVGYNVNGKIRIGYVPSVGSVIQGSGNGVVDYLSLQYFGGNVGIGTVADAGYKLDVNGTARFSGAVTAGINNGIFADIILDYNGGTRRIRPGGNSLALTDSLGNRAFQINAGGGNPQIALEHDGVNFVRGLVSLQYTMGSTQQVVLTSSNYIGHLTPFFDIKATGYANSKNTDLRLYTDNTTSGTYGNIIIGHNGTNATGNVGIGTSSPTSTLQVNGTASVNGQFDVINGSANFRVTNESTSYVALKYGISPWLAYNGSETYFQGSQFYYQSGVNFRFAGSGSFGFTSNPSARLHIKGSGSTSATTSLLVQNSLGDTSLKVNDNQLVEGFSGSIVRFKLGFNGSTGQAISTRDGQFAIGLIDTDQLAAIRFLTLGTGASYIDAYSEGTSKAANYPLFIGSRTNNASTLVAGSTTEENGTRVVFGSAVSDASALVQINSTTRGFLPPRGTNAQMLAIVSPAEGLVFYDLTNHKLNVFDGTSWVAMH